ncbi:DUF1800 domain-containing protein [Novosphingobium aquae]|uniref:DUF1800 domain-containing protein n=1 Tax=Novosphingobium aquae TaxID=3133435 RepID=A0ABU8S3W8_9SPHN
MGDVEIALNRFGLGWKAGEAPPANPRRWLVDQIARYDPAPAGIAALPRTPEQIGKLAALQTARTERRQDRAEAANEPAPKAMTQPAMESRATPSSQPRPEAQLLKPLRDSYVQAAGARMAQAVATDTPFMERLVAFWSNHFAVSIDKGTVIGLAGTFENEAIRPNVNSKFSDLLFAAVRHPAMLLFLDQAQSIGPNSLLGQRAQRRGAERKPGINENLAREIMELHTLGVHSGYTQADVTEFAKALTGTTVTGLGRLARLLPYDSGRAAFVEQLHEPGARTVMGKKYAQAGEAQGRAILNDLAAHPATARHVATKLARHFAADHPPPALVARLEQVYLKTGGDLPSLYRALVESPEPWSNPGAKFRQPWEWLVAVQRATGLVIPAQGGQFSLNQLGQPTWRPGSPAGWDDLAASWAAPDALLRRVELANRYSRNLATIDSRTLAPRLFPESLSEGTRTAVARADSGQQALALLLVSPEMLRR